MDKDVIRLLESSKRFVGTKQVLKALSEGTVGCVIVAEDADGFIKNKIVDKAKIAKAEILYYPSMESLGKLCEIDVKAAVVGLIKQ